MTGQRIVLLLAVLMLVGGTVLFYSRAGWLATACGSKPDALTAEPHFVGWVTGVESLAGRIVVEAQAEKIVSRAFVEMTSNTLLFRREGGVLRPIRFADVALQDLAQVWLTGPAPRSFPAQVTAKQMIVERRY